MVCGFFCLNYPNVWAVELSKHIFKSHFWTFWVIAALLVNSMPAAMAHQRAHLASERIPQFHFPASHAPASEFSQATLDLGTFSSKNPKFSLKCPTNSSAIWIVAAFLKSLSTAGRELLFLGQFLLAAHFPSFLHYWFPGWGIIWELIPSQGDGSAWGIAALCLQLRNSVFIASPTLFAFVLMVFALAWGFKIRFWAEQQRRNCQKNSSTNGVREEVKTQPQCEPTPPESQVPTDLQSWLQNPNKSGISLPQPPEPLIKNET